MFKRLKAAWYAFRNPDPPVSQTVEVPVEVVREVLVPAEDSRLGRPVKAPERPYRFTVVRQRPDGTDQVIYPEKPGQDRGGEARKYYERSEPLTVGETISFWDGEYERSRKVGR